jgi:hypothetical protein
MSAELQNMEGIRHGLIGGTINKFSGGITAMTALTWVKI